MCKLKCPLYIEKLFHNKFNTCNGQCTFQGHLNTCKHDAIPCTSKCGAQIPRVLMEDHLKYTCPQRRTRCEFCNKEFTGHALEVRNKTTRQIIKILIFHDKNLLQYFGMSYYLFLCRITLAPVAMNLFTVKTNVVLKFTEDISVNIKLETVQKDWYLVDIAQKNSQLIHQQLIM